MFPVISHSDAGEGAALRLHEGGRPEGGVSECCGGGLHARPFSSKHKTKSDRSFLFLKHSTPKYRVYPDRKFDLAREIESAGFPVSVIYEIRESLKRFPVINPQLCKWKGQSICDRARTHVQCCLPLSPGVSCDPLSSHVASHVFRAGKDKVWLEPDT